MEIFQKIFRFFANKDADSGQDEPLEAILDWAEDIDQLHIAQAYFDAIKALVTEQIVSQIPVMKFVNFDQAYRPSSSLFDDDFRINPATGLPMINSAFDVGGNPYGCDNSHWSSSHDHWGSSSFDGWSRSSFDGWSSSSFGSRWDY